MRAPTPKIEPIHQARIVCGNYNQFFHSKISLGFEETFFEFLQMSLTSEILK